MDSQPFRLLLVSLPEGAAAGRMDFAAPLGTRAALSARIVELLPGTAFDGDGRGTFRRGGYQIRFEYAGLEPTSIEVALERADAAVGRGPVRRLLLP